MKRPDTIMIEGRAYSWRVILEARRQQLEAWSKAQQKQLALFPLKDDARPKCERTTAGRYREPSLLALMHGPKR